MNVLVTGGAGYIGSHTVVELLQAGQTECLFVHGVSSDSIFLRWFGGLPNAGDPLATFYRIDLTAEELTLEYCGQVFEPSV